jgi:ankyrin repeat protein
MTSDSRFLIIKHLLEFKANINNQDEYGQSILHIAAMNADLDIAKLLISTKADVNIQNNGGLTPAHYALHMSKIIESINSLSETIIASDGSVYDINTPDSNGLTPLHIAITKSSYAFEMVEFLLNKNACVNTRTPDGLTPLDIAKKSQSQTIIKLLITAKANVQIC